MAYIKTPTLFKYLINFPEDHIPDKNYPLVVGLHGAGSNPENLITIWDQIPNSNFIYAAPQAPFPLVVDTKLVFDWAMWPSGDVDLINRATEISEKYIVDVVQDISNSNNIGEVYLMGFSQGAIFTYLVGLKQHHLFKGIICFSGPGLLAPLVNPFIGSSGPNWLTEEEIQNADKLRVFITHGKEDQNPKYELGIRSRDILIKHGHDVTFRDFVGGHTIPTDPILGEIVDWIKTPHQKE
ncbi:MAG: hypothetical protein MUO40_01375 [Anaerolineaceae bacterium]|nr:hypothetical protein [Anaerolineaceae bacterium]